MSTVADHLPQYSLSFNGTTDYLSMADADIGSFNLLDILSFTLRFKRDGTGVEYLLAKGIGNGVARGFQCFFDASDQLNFQLTVATLVAAGPPPIYVLSQHFFISTTTITDTDWHELLVVARPNDATSTNRLKMWIDGAAETASSSSMTNQGQTTDASAFAFYWGADYRGLNFYDGLMYNMGVSNSGSAWATTDVRESDGTAKDLKDLDLRTHPDIDAGEEESDWALSANWTNTGVVSSSTLGDVAT